MEQLPASAALSHLRRHRAARARRQCHRCDRGGGLVPGTAGLRGRPTQHLRRPARPARPAGDPLRRRQRADREHRRGLARPHRPDPLLRPLCGRDVRRPPGAGRLVPTRVRRRGLVRRTRGAGGDRHPGRSPGSAGAPDRGARAGRAADLPEWRGHRRLRSEPRRAAAYPRSPRRGRADDHPAPRRGPRSRRARHPAVAARAGDRSVHPARRGPRSPGSPASPTTASATPRSAAGPAN